MVEATFFIYNFQPYVFFFGWKLRFVNELKFIYKLKYKQEDQLIDGCNNPIKKLTQIQKSRNLELNLLELFYKQVARYCGVIYFQQNKTVTQAKKK